MRAYTGDAVEAVSRHEGEIWELSRKIWEHPETALEVTYVAEQLRTYLERQGFRVETGLAGMETAFAAEWGSGSPVIGFLGEYDALPDMSQALRPEREQIKEGGAGHAIICWEALWRVQRLPLRSFWSATVFRGRFGSMVVLRKRLWWERSGWTKRMCLTAAMCVCAGILWAATVWQITRMRRWPPSNSASRGLWPMPRSLRTRAAARWTPLS